MEKIIKQYECGQELTKEDLNNIINQGNSIIQYIEDHENEWSRSGEGNNVQITPIGNSGQRIAKYKIDNDPEGYIYAPTTTPGQNGDVTIIEPVDFTGSKVHIANYTAGNGSGKLYAPAPGSGGSGNGQNGQDGLSTLFAFKGFANDSDAESDWNNNFKNSRNYPPGNVSDGWSTSSNVSLQTGHMLYMTTAQRQGNSYITVDGTIWQKPVRIGSDGSTSTTGTDDDDYNYIYSRTTINVAPDLTGTTGQSSYGVHLLELIEADIDKKYGFKPDDINNPIEIAKAEIDDINKAWTDHPYGVSSQLPFEWQTGFKKNATSGNWEYYFGPVIISHYGHDGLDGDGLEYIFYLQPKNQAGIPSLGAPYDGRIGENGTITLTNVSVNSSDYQQDDFIPTGWHDSPQEVSEEYPRQYVSTRKKDGSQEANNQWKAFSTPRLWNVYATNGFQATLDNDTIIFDDDTDHDAIEYVSLTKEFLWDGANDVTLSNNYTSVTVTINCVGFSSELRPGIASIDSNGDVSVSDNTDWGTPMEINRSNYTGFALTKREGVGKLETKTGSITYTIRAYESGNDTPKIEASRIQTIQVVDINDGTAYSLQVTPNTLGVSRTNETSPYTLRDAQSITVTATAASGKKVEKITIKNCNNSNDIQNIEDNNLYVEVKDSEGNLLGISPQEFINTKSLVYTIGNTLNGRILSTGNNAIQYIVVDLYYKYQGRGIKIDSETVDFSIKGDKGQDGSGTESYVVTTLNDNAVIDDQTIGSQALRIATLNPIKVYKGNDNVTSSCTYTIANETLPQGLAVRTITDNEFSDYKCYEIYPTASIGVTLTPGNYYYDIVITHGADSVGTKRFKLYIDANISTDGSFYKLSVTNDIVNYNSEGNSLSDSNIVISAYKISLDGTSTKENIISKETSSLNSSNGLYVKFDNSSLYQIASLSNGEITISRTIIPYNANGYDVTLYNGSSYVDGPEHIDCIKDGAPGGSGNDGKDSVVYNLEPYPTSLKFNVESDGKTLTPSELVARCKISKTVGNVTTLYDNNTGESDPYYMYYNITTSNGGKINISQSRYTYVLYNNSDDELAGIHVNTSSSNLTYTSVNFYLAKASGNIQQDRGADSINIIKQVSVPILRDGLKGDSGESSIGQVGKFYYFAGDWDSDVPDEGLIVTTYSYPYVYYQGKYYMYIGTNTGSPLSKNDLGFPTGDNWEEIVYNKFAISEAMFANYAKLGAAIFNREWLISQYGSIGGTPSTDYTSFDPIKFMNAIKGYAEIGVIPGYGQVPYGENGSYYNILSQLFKLPKGKYTIAVTLNGSNNKDKSVWLVRFNDKNLFKDISKVPIIINENTSVIADVRCDTDDPNPTIYLNGGAGVQTYENFVYCLQAQNSQYVSVSSIKVKKTDNYTTFIPNYALDLRSGFVYQNNAYVKGKIEASEGKIGGFTIGQRELTNDNWQAGIDIQYDNKVVKIGENAMGDISTEDAIIRAENTKEKSKDSDTYNTALYLNSQGARYNYAFYGNGNGVLNGFMAGFKPQIITIPAGNTESNSSRILIREGSFVVIKGSHTEGHVLVGMPTLTEIRNTLGINNITPFFFELSIISYSTYEHVHLAFRGESGNSGSEYPVLMGYNDLPKMDGINQQTYWQIAQGDYFKILLTYIENTRGVLDYRAYVLSNLN